MHSRDFLNQVAKTDPVLAQRLKEGKGIHRQPVENPRGMTETRDLTDEEVRRLDCWIHG